MNIFAFITFSKACYVYITSFIITYKTHLCLSMEIFSSFALNIVEYTWSNQFIRIRT